MLPIRREASAQVIRVRERPAGAVIILPGVLPPEAGLRFRAGWEQAEGIPLQRREEGWLAGFARTCAAAWSAKLAVPEPKTAFTGNNRIWGKCLIREGTIILHRDLCFLPEAVIEEVILHEVCHFRRKEHDAAFWELMNSMMANWPEKEGILCRLGRKIHRDGKSLRQRGTGF